MPWLPLLALYAAGCLWLLYLMWTAPEGHEIPGTGFVHGPAAGRLGSPHAAHFATAGGISSPTQTSVPGWGGIGGGR